jgi:hypothetical protein
MGASWIVWPIDEEMASYLDSEGVSYPADDSRFPTDAEVRAALAELTDCKVELTENGLGGPWYALITAGSDGEPPFALLEVEGYEKASDPVTVRFDKGDEELVARLVERFALRCGPLVIMTDGDPQVIAKSRKSD